MQEYLEMNGAEVMTARNGHEGLELAIHGPDIIITDLAMPVMSGYEFLMALKDNRSTAQIPAIALTGHALDSYRKGAFEAGCHNFLVKPVKLSDLVREILDVLGDTENSSIFP
jgi:two-component system cell cycle response regulator DivK